MRTPGHSYGRARGLGWNAYVLAAVWSTIVAGSFAWNLIELNRKTLEAARIQARVAHTKDVDYRSWNAKLGGVYVPVTRQIQPNPFLKTPRRNVTATTGQDLTLINPAYMTRMVHRIGKNRHDVRGHITSLNPIRPENAADPWETKALMKFRRDLGEVSSVENIDGSSFMRLMLPLITEEGCLKCHSSQGYKLGDIRGGISVAVPMESLWQASHKEVLALAIGHAILWLVGLVGLCVGARRLTGNFRELDRMQESLKESEERYRLLFENTGVLVSVYNKDGVCLLVNKTVADYFGDSPTDLSGKSFQELHPEAQDDFVQRIREVIDSGRPKDYEDLVTFPQGQRWLLSNMHPVRNAEGKIFGAQMVSQDITDRKNSEELQRTVERFRAVSDLANGVAHNFNNILQIVLGNAEFGLLNLEQGNLASVRSDLETILDRSRFGAKVVKSLQSFTDAVSGRGPDSEVYDLSLTAEKAIGLSEPCWKAKSEEEGIKISLHRNLPRGCLVEGRESELLEVIVSLIKNAEEALPEGGEIRITTAVEEDGVILQVKDNGVGIPKENLSALFDPFWTGKGPQFLGMGLASSLGIVKRHGGDISVESEEGNGATFTIRLPLAGKLVEETEAPQVPSADFNLRILVVDDEPLIVQLLDKVLTRLGQTVLSAESGKAAIEVFKENAVDMVICDLGMPGMDGWEVFRKIRATCEKKGLSKPHFILLTGYGGQARERKKIAESGVDGVLDKPLNAEKLWNLSKMVSKRSNNFTS